VPSARVATRSFPVTGPGSTSRLTQIDFTGMNSKSVERARSEQRDRERSREIERDRERSREIERVREVCGGVVSGFVANTRPAGCEQRASTFTTRTALSLVHTGLIALKPRPRKNAVCKPAALQSSLLLSEVAPRSLRNCELSLCSQLGSEWGPTVGANSPMGENGENRKSGTRGPQSTRLGFLVGTGGRGTSRTAPLPRNEAACPTVQVRCSRSKRDLNSLRCV